MRNHAVAIFLLHNFVFYKWTRMILNYQDANKTKIGILISGLDIVLKLSITILYQNKIVIQLTNMSIKCRLLL
jgi:hypothetical protein